MRVKLLLSAVTAVGMAASFSDGVLAAGPPTTFTPDTPSCHGQFIASSNNNGIPGYSHLSIGQAAQLFGVSVKFLQGYADASCGT